MRATRTLAASGALDDSSRRGAIDSLAPYEEAFNAYAIAEYIKSQGSANYLIYEKKFWAETAMAKENKPTLFREAVRPYRMSPSPGS